MHRSVKVSVTIVLMAVLASAVDWGELRAHLQRFYWPATTLAFCAYGFQFFISGLKWQYALSVLGARLPAGLLVRFYCIAHFVGQFLPTAIGGDAYRIYRTLPLTSPRSRAVSAIALERLTGFVILLLMGGGGALAIGRTRVLADTYLFVLGLGIFATLLGILIAQRGGLRRLSAWLRSFNWFQALLDDYRQLRTAGLRWLPFIALSVLFQAISIGIIYVLFQGIQSHATLADCAVIAAVAGAATVLPISINGIGVVEGSLVGAAVALGLSYEGAFVVALLTRLLVAPLSLVCGLLYMTEPNRSVRPLRLVDD
jgi:glycosyltransferase 2 family protein